MIAMTVSSDCVLVVLSVVDNESPYSELNVFMSCQKSALLLTDQSASITRPANQSASTLRSVNPSQVHQPSQCPHDAYPSTQSRLGYIGRCVQSLTSGRVYELVPVFDESLITSGSSDQSHSLDKVRRVDQSATIDSILDAFPHVHWLLRTSPSNSLDAVLTSDPLRPSEGSPCSPTMTHSESLGDALSPLPAAGDDPFSSSPIGSENSDEEDWVAAAAAFETG